MKRPDAVPHVERDGGASRLCRRRSVERHERPSGRVAQFQQPPDEPAGERLHAGMDVLDADVLDELEADVDGGQAREVHGAVLERRRTLWPGGSGRPRPTRRQSCRRRTTAGAVSTAPAIAPGARRRRSDSRTSCRTTAPRSRASSGRGRAGWSARTRPRRAGRPSPAPAPRQSTAGRAGRPRSSTARDRRRAGDRLRATAPAGRRRRPRRPGGPAGSRGRRWFPPAARARELADPVHGVVIVERQQEAAPVARTGRTRPPASAPGSRWP